MAADISYESGKFRGWGARARESQRSRRSFGVLSEPRTAEPIPVLVENIKITSGTRHCAAVSVALSEMRQIESDSHKAQTKTEAIEIQSPAAQILATGDRRTCPVASL